MIHNSENKFIRFTLYKPYARYQREKDYRTGDIVWDDGVYYEYIDVDAKSGVPLSDNNSWNPLTSKPRYDTAAIVGMVIVIYFKGSRNIIARYSLNAGVGYEDIDDTDASSSEYVIELTEAVTERKKEGILLAEIKMVETNVNALSGYQTTIISDIHLSKLNVPITEFITVPEP